ncbi:MAG: glycosyl transferase family 2 [Actinomycetia bacterium]|nr:glycosyl transferase family 2 [Actinomycetes bacterium]
MDGNRAHLALPAISVVIPCRNAAATLPDQLEALAKQEYDGAWEVVVADNGSTDDSRAVAAGFRDRLPRFTLVDAAACRGQAYARNVGARVATGRALCFVDADDVVAPGYLGAMAAALAEHDFVSASFDSASLNPGWVGQTRRAYQEHEIPDSLGFLPFVGGGGLGIRRELFTSIGGFDDTWWGAGEDIDFCWRAQRHGAQLHFVPEASVAIRWRASLRDLYRQGRNYGRGEPYLFMKYRGDGMASPGLKAGLDEWWALLQRLPRLRTRAQFANWLRRAARKFGRLEACVRFRVVYL